MAKKDSDDPKKLLRCPSGCGNVIHFTAVAKCVRCEQVRCDVCMRRFKQRPHCKPCVKLLQKSSMEGSGSMDE